jgi:MFS family permease
MASIAALFGLQKLPPEKARALGIVYATSVALMMGVTFIQPALPALTLAFHVTDAELSWVMTVFTAPAIFLSPIFGVIADRYGRRLLLAFGMMAFGLFGAAMALAPNYTWLLVFRALQGVGFSAVIPAHDRPHRRSVGRRQRDRRPRL